MWYNLREGKMVSKAATEFTEEMLFVGSIIQEST